MRTYFSLSLLLSVVLLFVAACRVPTDIDVGEVVRATVTAIDRDKDGALSKQELRDWKNDPLVWLSIVNAIATALGLAKAQSTHKELAEVKTEVDEQWEANRTRP